ncbi:hypothetical protein Tco_0668422 [Tanacetum coccineum]
MLQIFSQRLLILADLTFWLLALDYLISEDVFVRVMIDEFVDQHNMVACLERTEENVEFHQIVDFLTTSSIHYALTQIHATVDGKTVVISESSVRSDLYFNDEDGITCLTNTAIFENLALMTSVPIPNVADEAVFKERDDRVVRATTTAASLDAAHASANITKTQSTVITNDPLSQEIGSGDRPGRQERHGGRKSDKTKLMFKDSDFDVLDDAMENVECGSIAEQITTAGDTLNTASINVSDVGSSTSTTGDIFEDKMTTITDTLMAIRSARPRTTSVMICNVKEEPRRATPVPIVQSQDKGKGKMVEPEPTPKNPRKAQIQIDEELTQRLFEEEQTQFERKQRISRERVAEQEAKDAALIEQMEDVQARMDDDEFLAARLQEQEREHFSVDEQTRFLVETIAARKKFFAAQREVEIRKRPPTRTQLRNQMITYLKHMGKYTHNQLKE